MQVPDGRSAARHVWAACALMAATACSPPDATVPAWVQPHAPTPASTAPLTLDMPEEPLLVMADLMALVIDPAAGVLHGARSPEPEHRPQAAEAWQALADAAQALERSAEVLAEPGWSLGRADWLQTVAALREGSRAGAVAARARDAGRFDRAEASIRAACDGCHARYAPGLR